MSRAIFKYEITMQENFSITMPVGAEILSLQVQREIPCIWSLVDYNNNRLEDRAFTLVGTGWKMLHWEDKNRKYIGTFQILGGAEVYHLFEVLSK